MLRKLHAGSYTGVTRGWLESQPQSNNSHYPQYKVLVNQLNVAGATVFQSSFRCASTESSAILNVNVSCWIYTLERHAVDITQSRFL